MCYFLTFHFLFRGSKIQHFLNFIIFVVAKDSSNITFVYHVYFEGSAAKLMPHNMAYHETCTQTPNVLFNAITGHKIKYSKVRIALKDVA